MASSHNAYEAARQARIGENRRRMEELGLVKLAKDLRSSCGIARQERQPRAEREPRAPRELNLPKRRSDRNAGVAAPNYNENALDHADERSRPSAGPREHVASQDEVYTDADIKKLGSCEKEWELFVDGYDGEGNRVYDKVDGETCHQCRQKTVCKHTACSSCHQLRGVFCGDCLFMRYGENLDEVMAEGCRDSWVCPVCRGLCNCSNHRLKRGWLPTGSMYRTAIKLGYASVAHYLVLSHQAPAELPPVTAVEAVPAAAEEPAVAAKEPDSTAPNEATAVQAPADEAPAETTPLTTSNIPNSLPKQCTRPEAARKATKAGSQQAIDVLLSSAAKVFSKTRSGKAKAAGVGVMQARGLGVASRGVGKVTAGLKRVTRASVVA